MDALEFLIAHDGASPYQVRSKNGLDTDLLIHHQLRNMAKTTETGLSGSLGNLILYKTRRPLYSPGRVRSR